MIIVAMAAVPAAAAQADATWTGTGGTSNWSTPRNWSGPAPTDGSTESLVFPTPGCNCYTAQNDLTGVTASSLVLSNTSQQYSIQGNPFTVGSGGIMDTAGGGTGDLIRAALILSESQTWVLGSTTNGYNSVTLQSAISGGGALTVSTPRGDLWVNNDMEVGPVTSNGPGGFHIGGPPGSNKPGAVNATDRQPFTITGGSLVVNPGSTTGQLVMNGGTLLMGTNLQNNGVTTLQVNGRATLSSSVATSTFINDNGSAPGTDFSQLSASGDVSLDGTLSVGQGPINGSCVKLQPGDVATLVTTSGTLSGAFSNAGPGQILTLGNSCGGTQVQIAYTSNSVTATVIGATTPTTTTLGAPSPSPASTNQPVTLTATVTTNGTHNDTPGGTVGFSANGAAIPGCTSQPISASGSSGTASCTTSFGASGSPWSLTAAFAPATGSGQEPSRSSPQSLTVNRGSTTSALAASNTNPAAGGDVTYTATVMPGTPGAAEPSGTVAFLDGGSSIPGCGAQPLTAGGSSSAATCTVSYPSTGSHSISAAYGGDDSFTGSTAPGTTVTVRPGPAQSGTSAARSVTSATPSVTSATPSVTSATTLPATGIGTTQATLNGTITMGGSAVTWKFEYGRGRAYGHSTPGQTIAARGSGSVAVRAVIKKISPNARYHFRLVVSAARQTADGKDRTFMSKSTGRLAGPRGQVAVIRGTILIVTKCDSSVLCNGRFWSTVDVRAGRHTRIGMVCASAALRVRPHRSATIRAGVSAGCLRLLKAQPHRLLPANYITHFRTGQLGQRRRITLSLR